MAVSFSNVAFTIARLAAAAMVSGVILTAAVAPAMAQDALVQTQTVSMAGLNLAKPADLAILRHRLALAARGVCRNVDVDGLDASDGFAGCYSDAMHNALKNAALMIAQAQSQAKVASK